MKGCIVLFHTELNTLNLFSKQMQAYFEKQGYEIFIFDLADSIKSMGLLYSYMQNHAIVAMIGFNSKVFGAQTASGVNIWETLGIPCINILVDHPYWYHDILSKMPHNSAVLCIDQNHVNYVLNMYPEIPFVGFLPHGGTLGTGLVAHSDVLSFKPMAERQYDVLYVGSLYAPDALEPNIARWGFDARELVESCVAYLKVHTEVTVEQIMMDKLEIGCAEFANYIPLAVQIERRISYFFREKLLESLAHSGVSLQIYGSGYEECDWIKCPNVHYGGMISPDEVLDKIADSKMLLNSMPWFKDGSHERIFNGMLNGTVVISEANDYLRETIPNDLWVSYELSDEKFAKLTKRTKELLEQLEVLDKMAKAAYQLAIENHTWEHRAKEIDEDLLSLF